MTTETVEAALAVSCPRCGALPSFGCRNEVGDVAPYTHYARVLRSSSSSTGSEVESS